MKKDEKHLTYFGDPLCNLFYFIARGVQLDNGVDPPWGHDEREHDTWQHLREK